MVEHETGDDNDMRIKVMNEASYRGGKERSKPSKLGRAMVFNSR